MSIKPGHLPTPAPVPAPMRAFAMALVLLLPRALAAAPTVPPGFVIDAFAQGPDLSYLTGIAFDSEGSLYVSEANVINSTGRVLRVADLDGDGAADSFVPYAQGFGLVTGIAFRGKGFSSAPPRPGPGGRPAADLERIRRGQFRGQRLDLFVSHFEPGVGGTISRVADRDGDGVAEQRVDVVTGLPSDGVNGNQQIAVGPDGRLYFGQGGRTNAGVPGSGPADSPLNGTILSVGPEGEGLEVHARGLRNVFDLLFTQEGELLATENGPDASGPRPVLGAPDELNAILPGHHYGWPDHFGFPAEDSATIGPIATFGSGTSTDGIALMTAPEFCPYQGDIFAAQFGSFTDPTVGRRLLRIELLERRGVRVSSFATGFNRPLDVAVGPDGSLWVVDFSNVFFAPGSATLWRIRAIDADANGRPDACDGR